MRCTRSGVRVTQSRLLLTMRSSSYERIPDDQGQVEETRPVEGLHYADDERPPIYYGEVETILITGTGDFISCARLFGGTNRNNCCEHLLGSCHEAWVSENNYESCIQWDILCRVSSIAVGAARYVIAA